MKEFNQSILSMKYFIYRFLIISIFTNCCNTLLAQDITGTEKFGNYTVEFYSNRIVKLKIRDKIVLNIPFSKETNYKPEVFMEDVDFDGDLDLFVSTSCGSNCSYEVYTNYRGNFALNSDLSKIAFFSDYFFDNKKKYFHFFQHESAISRKIKFYRWKGSKIVQFKELYENDLK